MESISFRPSGNLCFDNVTALQDEIKKSLKSIKEEAFVIDLSGIEKCDSAGLALLIDTISRLKKKSLKYQFIGISPELYSLAKFYDIESLLVDVL